MCRISRYALLLILASMVSETAPDPGTPGARPAAKRLHLPLSDNFDGGALAAFWRPGDYGAGRYVPGAISLCDSPVRSGRGSVRITVKEGDVKQDGGDGKETERAELDSGAHRVVGRDAWYGYSFLVPEGFPIVDNRLVISQWKQKGLEGGPLVGQRFRNGRHEVTVRVPGGPNPSSDTRRYRLPAIAFGKWNDVICHARFSRGDDGLVEMWMNGKKVLTHNGPQCFPGGEDLIYHKFGLYRDRWKEPMTIYFDNYTFGDSFEAVNPARFDR